MSDGRGMKTCTKILLAVFVAVASFALAPRGMPLARADATACDSRGYDPATCDSLFLSDIDRFGLPFNHEDPRNALQNAHIIADYLAGHPTMEAITLAVKKFLAKNPEYAPQMAVKFVKAAVHYYGPPGLAERLQEEAAPQGKPLSALATAMPVTSSG